MPKKFILHGGLYHEKPDNNIEAFGQEIINLVGTDSVKILLCTFARPKEQWLTFFEKDTNSFLGHFPKMQFILADPEKFIEQIQNIDVVYFRGGDTELILETIQYINGWQEAIKGKIFVGESAGAQFVSQYYYGLKSLIIEEGFGLLPIKTIVHWDSDYNAPNIDWGKAYNELKNHKEELPIFKLREGEFIVYNGE